MEGEWQTKITMIQNNRSMVTEMPIAKKIMD
jgi:hypothetical protein